MSFVPVQLNPSDAAVGESDMGSALEFSPSPRSIRFFKIRQITDAGPDRDDVDSFNLANDFKFHSSSVLSDKLIEFR
jgi:hypothetical protein